MIPSYNRARLYKARFFSLLAIIFKGLRAYTDAIWRAAFLSKLFKVYSD